MSAVELSHAMHVVGVRPVELARRLGVSASAVYAWRTGRRSITRLMEREIRRALGRKRGGR